MSKLLMLRGLPGSGKSTYARSEVEAGNGRVVLVNKDDIRASLGEPWSRELEKKVLDTRDKLIRSAFKGGAETVISDDTNLAPKHEKHLRQIAMQLGVKFEIVDFTTPIEECILRDSKRDGKAKVGAKVIKDMAKQFMSYTEKYEEVDGLRSAVICDLDGTLCLHNGRSPYEFMKCDTDLPNTPILNLLYLYFQAGTQIIYLSGREGTDEIQKLTQAWLNSNKCPAGPLLMRAAKDYRKDSVVKLELFDENVRGVFNVEFVLDDRQQVVDMWRSLGLVCLQVAQGNF